MSKEEYPEAAETIEKSSYMDDIVSSFEDHEVASTRIEQIDEVLARGGFKIKGWKVSGQKEENRLEMCTSHPTNAERADDKVLGVVWNVSGDLLEFRAKLNFSPKQKCGLNQTSVNMSCCNVSQRY